MGLKIEDHVTIQEFIAKSSLCESNAGLFLWLPKSWIRLERWESLKKKTYLAWIKYRLWNLRHWPCHSYSPAGVAMVRRQHGFIQGSIIYHRIWNSSRSICPNVDCCCWMKRVKCWRSEIARALWTSLWIKLIVPVGVGSCWSVVVQLAARVVATSSSS